MIKRHTVAQYDTQEGVTRIVARWCNKIRGTSLDFSLIGEKCKNCRGPVS